MASMHSVSTWLQQLKGGHESAAQKIWERYCQALSRLARDKLQGSPRRAADEEDVALSAFDSFFRGAQRGRFPQLANRDDLWQVLLVLTERKALNLVRHERRQKRGGGKVVNEPAGRGSDSPFPANPLEQLPSQEPTPQFAAQVAEECRRLLDLLKEAGLQPLALWKMEGYSNEEIAAKLSCNLRTVERKLRRIRTIWNHEASQP